MNRRCFLLTLAVLAPLPLLASHFARAAGPEPTYTAALPGDQRVHLQMQETRTASGPRVVRVWNLPKSQAKSAIQIDASVLVGSDGQPVSARSFLGLDPALGASVEAVRDSGGYKIREPAEQGDLAFGGILTSPLLTELFLGRQYDFTRGGPQTFAHLIDYATSTAKIDTLTLTAEGKEAIDLPDGKVMARRMRYTLDEPLLPESLRSGVFYVGPSGEVLKCDTALFGVALRAKGPAVWEDGGKRFTLRFKNPDSPDRVVLLQANKQPAGDWAISLELEQGPLRIATLTCDSRFQLKHLETPWHGGRPFRASVAGSRVHWTLAAGDPEVAAVAAGSAAWFLPYWFDTALWEGEGAAFSDLAVGDSRAVSFLPLLGKQGNGVPFTLEHRPDVTIKRADGSSSTARHYRFASGTKDAPGTDGDGRTYEIYTDGSRLITLVGSDGVRIVRDGWEAFAAGLVPPASPTNPGQTK